MASAAQITANRVNAQASTGPRTEAGKQASSRNALRHGLTGQQIVMPGEDASAYEELKAALHDEHRPANDTERVLVDQIAASSWRLMRAHRVETAVLAKLAEGAPDPNVAIAAAFLERPKDLDRILRYVTAAERAFYKSLNEFLKLKKEREHLEREAAMVECVYSRPAPPIGFVSQGASQRRATTASASTPLDVDREVSLQG